MKILRPSFILFALTLIGTLSACSAKKHDLTTDAGTLAEGERYMNDDFYEEARKQFYRIKTEFPQSSLQVQADLKIAESYYREESYKTAASSYEEFIKTYPGRPEIPDALFSLGMCYVQQMPSTAQRDTRATAKVVDTFTRLLVDYPNNSHIAEAQKHIIEARHQLADKIFEIGRFYEKMGDYDAAAKRYAEFVDQYADNPRVGEAMEREARSLRRAGKNEQADAVDAKIKAMKK
ncbi:MAG: outer membrane protein assembly factor BamD [Deltaproteobacteria bacterium]|nr:outer membrane protein assembly factor BamD [Deltaproteobacteria bacterium]